MSSNIFNQCEIPISKNDIISVETEFKFKFPVDFINHYLEYNGGCPKKNLFRKFDEIYDVSQFLSIKYGECTIEDFVKLTKVQDTTFPSHLIPFAIDSGGDNYCFSIRKVEYGAIYIFQHEFHDDPKRAIIFLATSLKEFIENMIEDEN